MDLRDTPTTLKNSTQPNSAPKMAWEKPEMTKIKMDQTLSNVGSVADGGLGSTP